MAVVIDPSWTEIQVGLYQEIVIEYAGNLTIIYSKLHSAEGYCFYDKTIPDVDDEGNPINRLYMVYMITPTTDIDALNAQFQSILIEDNFEIVGGKPDVEIV